MFFHIPSTSVLTVGPGCSLMAARWCRSSPVVPWRAGIADDCDILVHWCGRKHSISHMGNPMDRRTWWATVHGVARVEHNLAAAAAAAKSLQSCPTLCDPIDGSQPGSPIPGILQARVLEWAAISFSNAWKWKLKVKLLSRVWLFATPWIAVYQAPPSMGFSRQEYWSGVPLPSPNLAAKQQQHVYI